MLPNIIPSPTITWPIVVQRFPSLGRLGWGFILAFRPRVLTARMWKRGCCPTKTLVLPRRLYRTRDDRPNAPSFPCPASESETTWTHVKRLAGSHPSITFDSTQLSDALVWINVTTNPTAEWIAHQTTEAFPWDEAPRYLICDRDRIYDTIVTRRLRAMGIRDNPTTNLSSMIRDPFVRAAFEAAERDGLAPLAVLVDTPPSLDGGQAVAFDRETEP